MPPCCIMAIALFVLMVLLTIARLLFPDGGHSANAQLLVELHEIMNHGGRRRRSKVAKYNDDSYDI